MDDSFRVRVDKVFGSLSSSSLSSLWSLTDEEIEKREWNRDLNRQIDDDERIPSNFNGDGAFFPNQTPPQPQDPSPLSSNFGKELESDLQNLDDDDDDDEQQPSSGSQTKKKKHRMRLFHRDMDDDGDDDELDTRSSISLDCTLDYEEEEEKDEYDKVTVGREKAGDRLYMTDVTDYDGADINTYHELPDSFSSHFPRDPRANHLAAKVRLKEDTEAAGDFHSLKLSDNSKDAASIPKPILKKRQIHVQPKSLKRVRFDPQIDYAIDPTHHDERITSDFNGHVAFFSNQPAPQPQDPSPSSSNFDFYDDNDDDDDDDDDQQPSSGSQKKKKHRMRLVHRDNDDDGDNDDDELDIRSKIGLDCTLDYEEEEDEYDKVAVGREKAGDRLYMRDVTDYNGADINTYHEVPDSFSSHFPRDPRANHLAAKVRLKEDMEAAGDFHSLKLSDNSPTTSNPLTDNAPLDEDASSIPKPMLKKRQTHVQPKSLKRVCFDLRFDNAVDPTHHVEGVNLAAPPQSPMDDISRPNLPDYLRNPSKYTRYTLDSTSDMDDESNRRAYMDFLNLFKKPIATDETDTVDSSRPPTFTSRKPPTVKRENALKQNQGDVSQDKTLRIGIAGGDAQDSEVHAMDEDEPEMAINRSVQKPGRQYRSRTVVDSE